jgi:DNA-directed RNA polymerase specialized sigma24 family protein
MGDAAVSNAPAASEGDSCSPARPAGRDGIRHGYERKRLSTFSVRRPVRAMASHIPIRTGRGDDGDFLQSLIHGERGRALRAQLGTRYPDCSADTIDDAIQFACRCFLDEAEGIVAPGQVYAWIRTAANRNLSREVERHHREVAVDPVENGLDRLAAEEVGPAEELIGLEDDADLAVLVEKVSSSLTDRQRDVFALYGAGYRRPQIADRLGVPERDSRSRRAGDRGLSRDPWPSRGSYVRGRDLLGQHAPQIPADLHVVRPCESRLGPCPT